MLNLVQIRDKIGISTFDSIAVPIKCQLLIWHDTKLKLGSIDLIANYSIFVSS